MSKVGLSVRADAQLIDIFTFTSARFGRYQAEAYQSGLAKTFALICDFPIIGAASDEFVPGMRRIRFQSHYIFFTNEGDHILIRSIYHVRQRLRAELFE